MEDDIDDMPERGDFYECKTCGMEFVITSDCACPDPKCVKFTCCGVDMDEVL